MFAVTKLCRKIEFTRTFIYLTKRQPTSIRHFGANPILFAKLYNEFENKYAYDLMEHKGYTTSLDYVASKEVITESQLNELLQNTARREPKQLLEDFSMICNYCSEHNFCISNIIFDNFIDDFTDNLHVATDIELKAVFHSLAKCPSTKSIRTRNFIEVWAALDDECLRRLQTLSYDEMLHFVSLFFMINVTKVSDFSTKCLNKLATKAKQLTKGQLVQTMFFIGVMRKPPFDIQELELQLDRQFEQLSVDDVAIASMGFFKSKTPVRRMELIEKIIDRVIDTSKNVHEISLASLLKVIRYSIKSNVELYENHAIHKLFDTLQFEVPRLSIMCNVHIALLGMASYILHKDCFTKIAEKVNSTISQARMKDLERLVLTFGTLNFVPETSECFYQKVITELRKPEREFEISRYGKSFACCVSYLGLSELYPLDLIQKALDKEFLEKNYGTTYHYGREILTLHNTLEIFFHEAKLNRLNDHDAEILAKKYTDYAPDENYAKERRSITDKMFLEICGLLMEDLGGKNFVVGDHILTHHQRGDIILCNSIEGVPKSVRDAFNSKTFGLLRRPPDNNVWTVLLIVPRNGVLNNSKMLLGPFRRKIKELQALGFHATAVLWSTYCKLQNKEEKLNYLKLLIKEARRK